MKIKIFTFLLISLSLSGFSQDDVHLIDPIKETPVMSESRAAEFRSEQSWNNWGISHLGFDQYIGNGNRKWTGKNVKVCICDTGLPDHKDYKYKIVGSANFTSDESVIDRHGHATHVGGIVHEIAPDADLYFAKVLNDKGMGSFTGVAKGIDWCVAQKKDSQMDISLSLGGPTSSSALEAAIIRAKSAGAIITCAAGNEGSGDKNNIGYPGAYDQVITVGSTNINDQVSWYSSSGPQGDIMAPGEKILSTYLDDQYVVFSGTSMSTPFVAGIVALQLEHVGNDGLYEEMLEETATDMLSLGWDRYSFWGQVSTNIFGDEGEEPIDPEPIPDDSSWLSKNWIYLVIAFVILTIGVLWVRHRLKNTQLKM